MHLSYNPHCWGHLFFLRPLPKMHTSHQYLEDLHWFEDIFKKNCPAVFEAIEVKGRSILNFEVTAKLSEMITNFQGCNLKIQDWMSFDLNGLKNGSPKSLKIASNQCKSSKYWWKVWILGRVCKKPNVLSSEEWSFFSLFNYGKLGITVVSLGLSIESK